MSTGLAIFVKTPGLSPVKTRLATDLGRDRAEQFYRLSASAVAAVAHATMPPIVPYWAVAERQALEHDFWDGLPTLWQGDGDLGDRMHHIGTQLLARHRKMLLIGADAPQISITLLQQAVLALDNAQTPFVLGPAEDGGFWLFGTRQPVAAGIWQAPRYSSVHAAADLRAALAPHGGITDLPTLVDGDRGSDMPHIAQALKALNNPLPTQSRLFSWLDGAGLTQEHSILEKASS